MIGRLTSGVDVIIPAYNAARYLEEAVRSAAMQTLPPESIVVADDGSTDQTPLIAQRLAQELPMVKYLKLEHRGVSAARNAGIRASSSAYVAFLDADDIWHPCKLQSQLDVFFKAADSVGFVHTGYEYIDEKGSLVSGDPIFEPRLRGNIFIDLLKNGYVVSGSASSVVVRRSVLDRVGLFDNELYYGEDWDMWLRLAAHSEIDFCNEALVKIRINPNSAQRKNYDDKMIDFYFQLLRVYEKWPDHVLEDDEVRASLRDRAGVMLLPLLRRPWKIERFYRTLRLAGPFSAALFAGRGDLWFSVGRWVARYVFWKWRSLWTQIRKPLGG